MAVVRIGDWLLGPSVFVEHSNLHFGIRDLLQYLRIDWIVVSQPNSCRRRNRRFLGGLFFRWNKLPNLSCPHAKPTPLRSISQ